MQNEPNFRQGGIPHHSTIPLFHHSNPMPIVRNEPNVADRPGPRSAKCAKRTQFAGGRDTPLFHHSGVPVPCLFCETKPIGEDVGRGRPTDEEPNCAKRSQFGAVRPASGADYAKRTQFGRAGRPARHPTIPAFQSHAFCAKQTQFRRAQPRGGADRAKQSQFRLSARAPECKTKPIAGRSAVVRGVCGAKRSQFAVGAREWALVAGRAHRRTYCAKRSQFAVFRQMPGNAHPSPCARPHPTSAFSSYCSLPVRSVN
jgi:hypothetical protein